MPEDFNAQAVSNLVYGLAILKISPGREVLAVLFPQAAATVTRNPKYVTRDI